MKTRLTITALVLMLGAVVLLPPGLCPCWLTPEQHPHLPHIRPGIPHDHDYLNNLSDTTLMAEPILPTISAVAWLALTGLGTLLFGLPRFTLANSGVFFPPPTPPPRA